MKRSDQTEILAGNPFGLTWLEWIFVYWGGVAIFWQGVFLTGASYADGRFLMWMAIIGFIGVLGYLFGFQGSRLAIVKARNHRWILVGLGFFVVLLYWLTFYPSHDDATYMRRGMDYQLHPHVPLQEISREPGVRSYRNQRMMGTYDILRTTVSDGTPIPYLVSYYLIFPGLLAYLIPWVLYRFARVAFRSDPREALILTVIGVVLLFLWKDGGPGFRMMTLQMGKHVFAVLVVPLLLIGLLQLSEGRSWKLGGLLMLLFGLALGLQVSGLAVALLIVAFFGFAWFFSRPILGLRRILFLLPTVCYLLLAAVVVKVGGEVDFRWLGSEQNGSLSLPEAELPKTERESTSETEEVPQPSFWSLIQAAFLFESDLRADPEPRSRILGVYGEGWGGIVALFSLFAYLAMAKKSPFYYYTLFFLLVLLFPFTGYLMARLSGFEDFFWRWTWMMPILPIVSWVMWGCFHRLARRERSRSVFFAVVVSLVFIFMGKSGWQILVTKNEWYTNNPANWTELEPHWTWEDQGFLKEVDIEGYSILYRGVRF